LLLTDLLGEDVPSAVAALLAKHGVKRPAPGDDDETDLRHALYWLLKMAETTHRRALAPYPIDREELARFERAIARRPPRDVEHAQLHIDAPSTLRRAKMAKAHLDAHPGPVLAVGDDDAVTLALWTMGVARIVAVDIDERILAFLSSASEGAIETAKADVLGEPLPSHLRRACSVVLTDPIRDMDATISFLLFGAAAMRRDSPSRMYWADHPDWSFEHAEVVAALEGAGLHVAEVHHDLHAYPLDVHAIDLDRMSRELGIDRAWLEQLTEATSAWSHLYALERAR
jgi:hypothetical protein